MVSAVYHGAFGVVMSQNVRTVEVVETREECYWSHAWLRFKRSKGVGSNDIIECKFLSKDAAAVPVAHAWAQSPVAFHPLRSTPSVPVVWRHRAGNGKICF
jgi:hypothetical protein